MVEAGKPAGSGWDGARAVGGAGGTQTSKVSVKQEAVVEVLEVLAGMLEAKTVALRVDEPEMNMMALQQFWMAMVQRKKGNYSNRQVAVQYFALAGGRRYLFFLGAPEAAAGGKDAAPRAKAAHIGDCPPIEEPDAQVLASVRGFCRELAAWKNPAKLDADAEKAVRQLLADLGAEQFDRREAAEKALRAAGARLRRHLDEAARDRDEERSFRAKGILADLEPQPGKEELPGRAVDKLPGIMKERPPPRAPAEPGAEPGADPAGGRL